MSATLPTPEPRVAPELAPYWASALAGRLTLPRCTECGVSIWYPRPFCPDCGCRAVEWVDASGRGTVYTFTANTRGEGPYAGAGTYVLAYVELDEGPRVLTNVVDCDPADVHIGMPVEAVFHETVSGALLRFRPAPETAGG